MRAVLFLILCCGSIDLSYGQSPQEIKNPIPPISNKTEGTDKPKNNSEAQQAPAIDIPSSVNKSISGKLQIESEKYTGSGHNNATNWAEWLIAICTGILAFVTARLVYYTKKLWASTGDLVAGAKDTAERQLRAYVAIETVSINEVFAGGTPYAEVRIKNFGQTPAYELSCIGGIGIGISFDTLLPPIGSSIAPRSGLAPTAAFIHKDYAGRPLRPDEIAALATGTQTLWVYGEIIYRDAFGIDRFSNYRFMIGGGVGIHNTMCTCEQGNDEY